MNLASHPNILNYMLFNSFTSQAIKEKFDLKNYARISITQYFDVVDASPIKNAKSELKQEELKIELAEVTDAIQKYGIKREEKPVDRSNEEISVVNKKDGHMMAVEVTTQKLDYKEEVLKLNSKII